MSSKLPKLPLLSFCLFLGIFTFIFFDLSFKFKLFLFLIFVAIGVLFGVFAIKFSKTSLILQIVIICISAVVSLCSLMVSADIPKDQSENYMGTHTVEGYFTEAHFVSEYSSAYFVKITECDGKKTNFNTYLTFNEKLYADSYSIFSLDAEFDNISNFENLNLTSRSFSSNNVFIGARAISNVKFSGEKALGLLPFFTMLNNKICERLLYILSEDSAGLVSALLFGNKDHLSQTLERDFLTLGITHMLVVSGMNIALIAGEFELLFKGFIKSKKLRALLCCGICILYMLLCRLSLSVVRAAIMQVIYRLSPIFAREYDSKTSLFLSLGIILVISPGAVFDIGLLLSFFATLGIILFSEYTYDFLSKLPTPGRNILSSLFASFSACIFVLPISLAVFECTSLASPVFTLLFSVFLDFLLYLTPVLILSSYIPFLGDIVIYICELLCRGIYAFADLGEVFSDLFVSLSGKNTFMITLLIALSVLFALLFKTDRKIVKVIPSFVLYFGICFYLALSSQGEGIYYYTNNKNDAVMINYNSSCTLIDISSGELTFTKNAKSALIASELGSTNIDTYVITHSHLDHLISVDHLAAGGYLSSVYLPQPETDDEITVLRELEQLSKSYNFSLNTYSPSSALDLSGIGYIFYPPMKASYQGYHDVLLFELIAGSGRVLYAGQNIADTDFEDYSLFGEASAVILGSHYPSLRKSFSYRLFDTSAKFIVSSKDIVDRVSVNIEKTVPENGKAIEILILP